MEIIKFEPALSLLKNDSIAKYLITELQRIGVSDKNLTSIVEEMQKELLNRESNTAPQKFWTGKYYKTCFNCQHGEKEEGTCGGLCEQPISDSVTCVHGYDEIYVGPTELDLPNFCGHYTPVVISQKCGNKNCKNIITGNEFEHEYWVTMFDNIPCCSKKCVDTVNKEFSDFEEYHNTSSEEY